MHILRIGLVAGIAFTILLMVREVVNSRAGRSAISPRQRVIRLCSGIVVILLLALILADSIIGVFFAPGTHGVARHRYLAVAYISAYLGIVCLLMVLALLDVREALRIAREDRRRMRNMLFGEDGGDK